MSDGDRFRGCPHCVGELEDLEQINQQLQEKGCAVVGMTIDDDEVIPEAKAVLEENGVTYTNMQTTGADGIVSFDRTSLVECHVHVLKAPEGFAKDDTEYAAKVDESEMEIVLKK